jgi:hypothetical protein
MAEIQSSFLHCTIAAIPADLRSLNGHGEAPGSCPLVGRCDVSEPQVNLIRGLSARKGKDGEYPAISFKTRGFDDLRLRARPVPLPGAKFPRHTGKSRQRDLQPLVMFGSRLVICHGKPDKVQRCAENERRVRPAPPLRNCVTDICVANSEAGGRQFKGSTSGRSGSH